MPLGPTRTPSCTLTWACGMDWQPASTRAAIIKPIFFIACLRVGADRAGWRPCIGTNTGRGWFIPSSAKKRSAVAALHGALDLALALAVLDGVALVVLGLALGQGDLAFHEAVFPVQIQRNQGVALLLDLADQALDLVFFQQQLLGACGFGGDMRRGRVERVDLATDQEQLAFANDHVAIGQLHLV